MKLICDTDILSIFAKVDRLDLLKNSFPDKESRDILTEMEEKDKAIFKDKEKIFD